MEHYMKLGEKREVMQRVNRAIDRGIDRGISKSGMLGALLGIGGGVGGHYSATRPNTSEVKTAGTGLLSEKYLKTAAKKKRKKDKGPGLLSRMTGGAALGAGAGYGLSRLQLQHQIKNNPIIRDAVKMYKKDPEFYRTAARPGTDVVDRPLRGVTYPKTNKAVMVRGKVKNVFSAADRSRGKMYEKVLKNMKKKTRWGAGLGTAAGLGSYIFSGD